MKKFFKKEMTKQEMKSVFGGVQVITPTSPGYNPQPTPVVIINPQPIGGIPYMYTLPPNGLPNNGWIVPK